MDKKGISTLVIWIIVIGIIFVVIISLILGLIVAIQKGKTKDAINFNETNLKLYLKAEDSEKQVKSNYMILDKNNTLLSKGNLSEETFTEIRIPKINETRIFCWDDNYYISIKNHTISEIELNLNASRFICDMQKSGNISIKHEGNIAKKENIIPIMIQTDKSFKRLSFAVSWTTGILNVNYDSGFQCSWLNYSNYNQETKHYAWLPEKHYLCGDELFICDEINPKNECIQKEEIPSRFGVGMDKAFTTGKSLNNETYSFNLNINTVDTANLEDYIQLIFYDKDLRYMDDKSTVYLNELNGENLGNQRDFPYRIYLNGTSF